MYGYTSEMIKGHTHTHTIQDTGLHLTLGSVGQNMVI